MSGGAPASGPIARHVYCGTSDFAVTVLRGLVSRDAAPALVVTPPDRRRGRGRRLASPPVAEAARELGIVLHQTASINDPETRATIAAAAPEVGTVCAFGQLISEPLLSELPLLNVHPSLLPRWRGAAPIERALIAGDSVTGVCVIRLAAELDSGPTALCSEFPISPFDDYGSLATRLAGLGGELLAEALRGVRQGSLELTEQDREGVTYAEKVDPSERRLAPERTATELARLVRALTPHIGAYVETGSRDRLGVRGVESLDAPLLPGAFASDGQRLLFGCAEGSLALAELQPAGRRWMPAADYLRGHGLPDPDRSR